LARVKEALAQENGKSAEAICRSVIDHVQQFMCAAPTHDDVTVLALARNS
jgi:serine phosphatase RsbU (regulator of sigma subunit)